MPSINIKTNNKYKPYQLLHKLPTNGVEDEFIYQRISKSELGLIKVLFERYQEDLYYRLKDMPLKKALHVTNKDIPQLPRSLLVYLNERKELCYLIQLKAHLANGIDVIGTKNDKKPLHIGEGGFRTVKYLLDPDTLIFYAETISQGEYQENELMHLQQLESPYINPLICYAQYINSKGKNVTITVSPYQKHGTVTKQQLLQMNNQQKIQVMLQLLLGIKTIHDKGNSHNDLKLNNILITNTLGLLIIDLDGMTQHKSQKLGMYSEGTEAPELYRSLPLPFPTRTLAQEIAREYPYATSYNPAFNHQLNDIWALGMMAFAIACDNQAPTLDFVELSSVEIAKKDNILVQLSHALLRPLRYDRPPINDAIVILMSLIAKKRYQHNIKGFYKVDSVNDALLFCEQLFPECANYFFNLSLELQKKIIGTVAGNYPEFSKLRFFNEMSRREKPLRRYFSIKEICDALFNETIGAQLYLGKLQQINLYMQQLAHTERQTLLVELERALSNQDFSELLFEFHKNKQNTHFKALRFFIISFPQVCNFDIYNYSLKMSKLRNPETMLITEMGRFAIDILSHYSQYDLVQILIRNFVSPDISKEKLLHLVKTVLTLNLNNRSSKPYHVLVRLLLLKGITVFQDLHVSEKEHYKKLCIHYANSYASAITEPIRKQLFEIKIAIPVFIRIAKNLKPDEVFNWLEKIAANVELPTAAALRHYSNKISPDFWTLPQRRIIAVLDAIVSEPGNGITAENRLVCFEKIFEVLQLHQESLYPQRHKNIDAIAQFLGRGETVTKRRAIHLLTIRELAYDALNKAANELSDDNQKINLYREYKNKELFKFHRKNSFFNELVNRRKTTHHQNLIDTKIQMMTSRA